MNVEIDLSAEEEPRIEVGQHGLSGNEINIAGVSLLLSSDQLDKLYDAIRGWYEDV